MYVRIALGLEEMTSANVLTHFLRLHSVIRETLLFKAVFRGSCGRVASLGLNTVSEAAE